MVACSCVWAWPTKATKDAAAPEAVAVEVKEAQTSQNSPDSSVTEQQQINESLNKLLEILNGSKYLMGASKIEDVLVGVEAVSSDIALQNALIEAQNTQITDLKGQLKKATRTKFFADMGVVLGFQDALSYGVVGDLGMKTGGVMVKTGLQYTLGNTAVGFAPAWDIRKMSVTATVGYEW